MYSSQDNPFDHYIRVFIGAPVPTLNECGYPGRYECEDTSRMFGWGIEGKGPCDYPEFCAWYWADKCPLGQNPKNPEKGGIEAYA